MSRGFGQNKRERETERARKRLEKERRRAEKRHAGARPVEVISAEEALEGMPTVEQALERMEARSGERRSATPIAARLFVGGLHDGVKEADLRALFGTIGEVTDAIVMLDRATRAPRGFAFITMADRRDAARAIEQLDGTDFGGRRLAVHVATDRGR